MIEAGTILQDRYRIEKQIGQGGMGAVFVATDQRFGSVVAIKQTFFEDEKLQKAFEREARLLNSLKHSALPKVIDYFAEDGGQFIVMEFIAGDDLSETMEKRDVPFPVDDVLNWADQLCEALNYLHGQEMPVIHRDIKPQNLKLTSGGQIILLDFGLAKGNPTDVSHKTAAKSIFGYSRSYASLEQIQGTGTDPRSDLYSLAATLYHLLTGIPPADALTRAMNVLNGQPDPLVPANLLHHGIPDAVARIISRSMALSAAERPESAAEMRRLLESADRAVLTPDTVLRAHAAASTELLSQETKLMPQTTNVVSGAPVALSEDAAAISARDRTSKVTEAQTMQPASASLPRRFFYLGAAALIGFLVIGGLSYYIDLPSGPEPTSTDVPQNPDSTGQATVEANTDQTTAGTEQIDSSEPAAQKTGSPNGPQTIADTSSAQEKSKQPNGVSIKPDPQGAPPDSPDLTFTEDGERIRLVGDRIETDSMIIDENGVRWKDPSKDPRRNFPGGMPIPPEEMRKLTPKQRQKIGELLKARDEERRLKMEKLKVPVPQPPANN